uniref:LIM zinc-binding domain-containing protein n=1 Tax=Calidris pygmaea TaxID=425635 RepID=A0A8C3JAW9_9CHAR
MSLPSPAWPQRDEPPPCGTAIGLPPASSDSDSGCALEEYPEPPADPAPPEVGSTPALPGLPLLPQPVGGTRRPGMKRVLSQPRAMQLNPPKNLLVFLSPVRHPKVPACFGTRSPQDPSSPTDRIRLRARALLQQLPPQDCDVRHLFLGCCPPRALPTVHPPLTPHLPVQERYCPDLAEEERRQLRAFSARRRREALGQGLARPVPGPCHGCPCKKCGGRLNKGDPGISAARLGDQFWHPSCFSCHFCHQPLVDLIYFQQDGRIYCGRHHAELFRPRCASCDQLIFMEECIEAEGRRWHLEHFCCLECEVPLRGQRYVMKSGRPCCRGCFETLFAETCQACGDPIGTAPTSLSPPCSNPRGRAQAGRGLGGLRSQSPGRLGAEDGFLADGGEDGFWHRVTGRALPVHPRLPPPTPGADSEEATHQGLHWHARAACFCCSLCRKPLRGQPLTSRRGRLFCSETCSLGRDASSTASDSSDSAFASAPSPDSTPLARAGPAGRTAPGTGSSSAAGGCRQRVEGAGRDPTALPAAWREGSGSKTRLCSAPGRLMGYIARDAAQGAPSPPPAALAAGVWLVQASVAPQGGRGLAAGQAQPSPSSPILVSLPPEAFLDQAPVHPAFRSLEDHGAAAKERSRDAVHAGTLGPAAGHPSALQPSTEGPNGPGALGHPVPGGPDPRTPAGNGNPHFQHSPRPEDIDLQDITEEDDSWCPTCSSSSDSEEEGFFFGKPIPKPGMSSLGREPLGRAGSRTVKPRGNSKHCSVS